MDVKSLIDQYNNGTLPDKEKAQLESWYINEVRSNKDYQGLEENLAKLDENLRQMMNIENVKKGRLWPKMSIAASFLVLIGISLYFYSPKSTKKNELTSTKTTDINPAGNKAYLTLANGKRIALTDGGAGIVATQENVQITRTANGQLVYTDTETNSNSSAAETYNTFETPKGGRYEIILPDGTHVWLNAASSLKYPASFALLKERKVELQGEAYFEVAHDKQHPFIVKTNQQEVKVLGTHFNISSYADEPQTKTTLFEGSVNISQSESKSKILIPGQQAILRDGQLLVSKADLDQALSWKNGEFVFIGEDLKTVMREVSRWYNVDVEYNGDINSSGVISTISRTKKLSQLLKALEANLGIHFKIEGRRVLVMP